jgi:hypothetical protein
MSLLNIKQLVASTQHKLPRLILQVLLSPKGTMVTPKWSVAFLQVYHLVLHIDATDANQSRAPSKLNNQLLLHTNGRQTD